jgi:hypothetical protein
LWGRLLLFLFCCFLSFLLCGKGKKSVVSSFSFERGEKRGLVLGSVFVVARVDGGTELWSLGSFSLSNWTDLLKLFELIVSMSQSDRWSWVELCGVCWCPNPTHPVCFLVVWSTDRSHFGVLHPLCCAVDRPELYGFRVRFSL